MPRTRPVRCAAKPICWVSGRGPRPRQPGFQVVLPRGHDLCRSDADPAADRRVGQVQHPLDADERGDEGDCVPPPQRAPLPRGVEGHVPDFRQRDVLVVRQVQPRGPADRREPCSGARRGEEVERLRWLAVLEVLRTDGAAEIAFHLAQRGRGDCPREHGDAVSGRSVRRGWAPRHRDRREPVWGRVSPESLRSRVRASARLRPPAPGGPGRAAPCRPSADWARSATSSPFRRDEALPGPRERGRPR